MRTVVVGASSGLGRSLATGLGQRGATVALLARRKDRLDEAAREAGPQSLAIVCDVTDELSCKAAVEEAAESLGGIDALVYATGVGPLGRLVDIDAATWRHTFDTNVVGAALITAAAVPHLTETRGVAAYLSSVSASVVSYRWLSASNSGVLSARFAMAPLPSYFLRRAQVRMVLRSMESNVFLGPLPPPPPPA